MPENGDRPKRLNKIIGDQVNKQADKNETVQKARKIKERAKRAASASRKAARSSFAAFRASLSIIANPLMWVVSVIIFIVIFVTVTIIGLSQVVGHNENIDGCSGWGDSIGDVAEGDKNGAINVISSFLMRNEFEFLNGPMSKSQAAAVIGNMEAESGLNPKATQSSWISSDASNEEILSIGARGGRAIGLMQWDGSRRVNLVNYAQSESKKWSDIKVQLEFLASEMDGLEKRSLSSSGFNNGTSADDLAIIFHDSFVRSADNASQKSRRARMAIEASNVMNPLGSSGSSCLSDFDNSDSVSLAISISLPNISASKVDYNDPNGVNKAPEAYKAAKREAENVGGEDGYIIPNSIGATENYASCDRLVATVVKNTMDPDIPWGSTINQFQYLNNSPRWERYDDRSQSKPGDVWITIERGHVVFYVGEVNGVDSISHASHGDRVAGLGPAAYINQNFVDTSGRKYAGFRFVG